MTKEQDIALLDKALALDTITIEQRRAFSQMREALEQREHVTLSPKQRLWVEQVIERGAGTTGLAALKTILSNLDGIAARDKASTADAQGVARREREFDVDRFVEESHHDVAGKADDGIPF
jgi:hypothetical protein